MRGTGGNLFYDLPMTRTQLECAIAIGLDHLQDWAIDTGREFDPAAISIDTKRVGDRVSVSVTGDLVSAAPINQSPLPKGMF